MHSSDSIKAIAEALSNFNSEVSKVSKDANNPFFKNNYATLDQIIDEVRPILQKNGLSILQLPGGDGEKIALRTLLIHQSGEWIESEPLSMKPVKNDPQSIGSAITYARRYSMSAFLSLNTGEDDDGNAATQKGAPNNIQKNKTQPSNNGNKASEAQIKKLNTVISKLISLGGTREQICNWLMQKEDVGKFDSMKDLTSAQVSKAIQYVESSLAIKEKEGASNA
ncbi:ERF family protein [Brevibacillus laterosporus]|uniref:ERF family protein n=1 Tax=Brevibacillus laterosporus TaxID=1465 RepID=UPI00215CF5AB|nr:ERF family protein [Brevibacillus laterosporus]MCR8939794.1 ERF family protein [Brevibacillus laterosporus]MCZ0842434.1 ERF family protein [Brevibacillus laterosporus]MCZ0846431.1 ERF family protein [Brevibacillus laterosporus]